MSIYKTINPATGELGKEFDTTTDAEVEEAVNSSHKAFDSWQRMPIEDRAAMMSRAGELMHERKAELANLITLEMGKLPSEAEGEVELSANILKYYGRQGPAILADEQLQPNSGGDAVVVNEPIGPLMGVMPWNFPQYQVARFAGPNLVAGNTILLKHAPDCPQSALAFERMAALRPGDPADTATNVAPLHDEDAAQKIMSQVNDAVEKGATVRTGGHRLDRAGAFVEPTVLTGVTREMRAFGEELFGPVAVVYEVANEDEAVELANESSFGLGGSVISDDVEHARQVARRVDTGMVWINKATWTEPDLPFGGAKRSGIGTELGEAGIQQFLNKKLIRG